MTRWYALFEECIRGSISLAVSERVWLPFVLLLPLFSSPPSVFVRVKQLRWKLWYRGMAHHCGLCFKFYWLDSLQGDV